MRRKVDREHIIEKGLELMYSTGYEATGIKEIADASGILKGSFYNYFSSKEAYAKELIDTYCDQVYALTERLLTDQSKSPVLRLRTLFDVLWQKISGSYNYSRGCFLGNFSQEIGDSNPYLSEVVNRSFQRVKVLYVACLEEALEKGEIDQSYQADSLAEFIIVSWQGVMLRAKSARNSEAADSFYELVFGRLLK